MTAVTLGLKKSDSKEYQIRSFVEKTQVKFAPLHPDDINAYIDSGEPFDKAGGYGIQSAGTCAWRTVRLSIFQSMNIPVFAKIRGTFLNFSHFWRDFWKTMTKNKVKFSF